MKIQTYSRQITLSKIDEICPLTSPNQISTISMHTPSLVKIYWCLLKLSSGNENMDGRMYDRRTDRCRWTDTRTANIIQCTIIPHHYHVAGYKKRSKQSKTKPLTFTTKNNADLCIQHEIQHPSGPLDTHESTLLSENLMLSDISMNPFTTWLSLWTYLWYNWETKKK